MAVVSVAVCPHPPLLIPDVAAGAAYELDDLRAACDVAVSRMLERCQAVRLLASSSALPSALDVGRYLLSRIGAVNPLVVDVVDGPRAQADSSEGLLVMADGSARRNPKAPGALHPDAEAFDRGIVELLATGREPDLSQAAEMWCTSAPTLAELTLLTAGQRWEREVLYEDAPYGVAYLVASWVAAGA